jgi:hypothetical protein
MSACDASVWRRLQSAVSALMRTPAYLLEHAGRELCAFLPVLFGYCRAAQLVPTTTSGCNCPASLPRFCRRGSTGVFCRHAVVGLLQDETLENLIKTSLAGNYDLAAAVARVKEARQGFLLARARAASEGDVWGRMCGAVSAARTRPPGLIIWRPKTLGAESCHLDQRCVASLLRTSRAALQAGNHSGVGCWARNPAAIETSVRILEEVVPLDVLTGLSSALLDRRPDVLGAAPNVRAANARIGVARVAYFPSIGLTTPLADVTSGDTNVWSLGSSVSGPIFQGGGLTASGRQLGGSQRAHYLQTALNAFKDVSARRVGGSWLLPPSPAA